MTAYIYLTMPTTSEFSAPEVVLAVDSIESIEPARYKHSHSIGSHEGALITTKTGTTHVVIKTVQEIRKLLEGWNS